MLSRRHLRIKVMQALYAYNQASADNIPLYEKELLKSIYKTEELFIYFISALLEIRQFAEKTLNEAKAKRLPTKEDLDPNLKFANNRFLLHIENNEGMKKALNTFKINWVEYEELIKKLYLKMKASDSFKEYMSTGEGSFEEDREYIIKVYKVNFRITYSNWFTIRNISFSPFI